MAWLTDLVNTDIEVIEKLYDLEVVSWQPLDGGDENSSFMLKGGDQDYVLTFYEKRPLEGVETLANLLNHLARNEYHTNRAIATRDGGFIPEFKGKPMLLKTWIAGRTLRDTEQSDYRSIGRSLAELHGIPVPEFLPRDHPYGLKLMPQSCGNGVDRDYEKWLADKIIYLESSYPPDLPKTLIHGDLFDDNIIYKQGEFQAIIDFGEACHYTRAYDLGSVLFGSCMVDGRLDVEHAREVMEGYRSLISLEARERGAIYFFAVYAGAAISAWHYQHTFLGKPDGERLDKYLAAAGRTDHLFCLEPAFFDSFL